MINNSIPDVGILLESIDGRPEFLALKSYIGLREFWYRLLKLSKDDSIDWEKIYQDAVEDESSGPELYKVIGRLPFEKDFVGINCLYFSYQMFILCEEIVVEVENNHIFLQNASIYVYSKHEYKIIRENEDLYLTSSDTHLEISDQNLVDRLNNLSVEIIDFDEEGDIFFKTDFEEIISKFDLAESDVGNNFWEINFSDLEALIEVSTFWDINSKFNDEC
jgi:hypothetical protein